MIILHKKDLLFFFILLILPLTLFIFIPSKTTSTSSIPISNHVIILDAGHGLPDGGATGNDGSTESQINLGVVLKLQKYLETSGTTVILTRSDENGIYDSTAETIRNQKVSDMKNRVDIGNNSDAEFFISIHMNKIPQKQYSGPQVFYKNTDNVSKQMASSIQNSLNDFLKPEKKREIKSISNIYLTQNVNIPLVLVECGFLSNDTENKLLQTNEYQEKLAWSIYIGLINYFH